MPHPILVTTAVTASALATALAVEHFVFRPWRQDNWPEGFVPGMKREWEGFKADFKQGLHEIAGGREEWPGDATRRGRALSDASQEESKAEEHDDGWGRSKEVAAHEEEMQLVRRRQAREMDLMDTAVPGVSQQDGPLEAQIDEEQHVLGTPPLSPSRRPHAVQNDPSASVTESWDALSESKSPFDSAHASGNASLVGTTGTNDGDEGEWERLSNSSTEDGSVVSLSRTS